MYENKDKMAAILNYAVLNKMNDLAEELTNIYSNDDWFCIEISYIKFQLNEQFR